MDLTKFLIEAKKNTYASNREGGEKKLENGGREFTYSKNGFVYIDTYFGFNPFIGQERVLSSGKVIWVMNYWGLVLKHDPKEVYAFLKKRYRIPICWFRCGDRSCLKKVNFLIF